MPRLTSVYDPEVGPLVTAIVSEPASLAIGEDSPRQEKVAFLIDTGASDSSISGRITDRLNLPVVGLHTVVGFGSSQDAHQHLADVELLLDEIFSIRDLELFRFDKETQSLQGILGRDVLGLGSLFLDGPNRKFTLTF